MPSDFDTIQAASAVYAASLLDLASQAGRQAEIGEELADLRALWSREPQFAAMMSSPAIDADGRRGSIRRLFTGKLSDLTLNLLLVLNDKGRASILAAVCDKFRQLLEEQRGQREVYVTSAVALSDAQRASLKDAVRKLAGIEPLLVEEVSPDVLGGIRVRVGDQVIDRTVAARLRGLRTRLRDAADGHLHKKAFVTER